ncbi:MAG: RDD family protein [Flammeovirgaceae bacterium]
MAKKQFDLSDLKVADELQGAELASFSKRSMAYALDWLIIGLSIQYLQVGVLVLVTYLVIRKRVKQTMHEGSRLISGTLDKVDQQLGTYEVNDKLRANFHRFMKNYIHILLYAIIISSLIVAIVGIIGMFMTDELKATLAVSEDSFWLQPFQGILTEVKIIFGALSGLFYFSFFTWKWNGQTPGKRIMGIKVAKLNGKPISLFGSFERVSGYTASASLLLTGFFQYFWDRNHQTTHDKIVETIVINVNPATQLMKEMEQQENKQEEASHQEFGEST